MIPRPPDHVVRFLAELNPLELDHLAGVKASVWRVEAKPGDDEVPPVIESRLRAYYAEHPDSPVTQAEARKASVWAERMTYTNSIHLDNEGMARECFRFTSQFSKSGRLGVIHYETRAQTKQDVAAFLEESFDLEIAPERDLPDLDTLKAHIKLKDLIMHESLDTIDRFIDTLSVGRNDKPSAFGWPDLHDALRMSSAPMVAPRVFSRLLDLGGQPFRPNAEGEIAADHIIGKGQFSKLQALIDHVGPERVRPMIAAARSLNDDQRDRFQTMLDEKLMLGQEPEMNPDMSAPSVTP